MSDDALFGSIEDKLETHIYHYTSAHKLLEIFESGSIYTSDSLLDLTGASGGNPYVVWLTDLTFLETPQMLKSNLYDKAEMRVVVEKTSEYIQADKWYKEKGATDDGIEFIEKVAGSSSSTWYVLERELCVDEFIRIEYLKINPQDTSMRYWEQLDIKKFVNGEYTSSKNDEREHDNLLYDIDKHLGID